MRLWMVIFSQIVFHKTLLMQQTTVCEKSNKRNQCEYMCEYICAIFKVFDLRKHKGKLNSYFLANVLLQCCLRSKLLSTGSHVKKPNKCNQCIAFSKQLILGNKQNGYFLANVFPWCCWCSKPLSVGSHVSQIAIFFHVPPSPSLHHTPENTKFCHCILVEEEFQNEILNNFSPKILFLKANKRVALGQ